jgi:hypothetical protein
MGRALKWDTVIEQKTLELGQYLIGRTCRVDFSEPCPTLQRTDNLELRRQILRRSESEALRLGIGKNTLRYLRKNARGDRPFKVCSKIGERLVPSRGNPVESGMA